MEAVGELTAREAAVRAASRSLSELLDRDPLARRALLADDDLPDRAAYLELIDGAFEHDGFAGLRTEKRRRILQIAGRDLCGEVELEAVGTALADLADACLDVALRRVDPPRGLAVIGMGKLGGRELNYYSDIDVMFVADGDLTGATKAAETLMRTLGAFSPEGQAFRIDANLRPEGRSGALVRSVEAYLEYYERWADPWEYQALIKARACAGDQHIGSAVVEQTRDLVFPEMVTPERVTSIRLMKERVEQQAVRTARRARGSEADDVKLGPGGIRDIEFSVQLLQLVHGGTDPSVRDASTLAALQSLVDGGYVAEEDGAGLSVAYRWLRTVEHRLQLWQERRVHQLPRHEEARARLARVLGFRDSPVAAASKRFDDAHRAVLADVRGRFERLFYRPMIESLADPTSPRLSTQALKERLRILGFRDVDKAARTLHLLVGGTSRRAKLLRVLTPAFLRFSATTPLPDDGLLAFVRLGEALGDRLDALGGLRDNPPGLALLARVLGSGRLLGDVLVHVPEELQTIADPNGLAPPKDRDRLVREATASLEWRDPDRRLDGLRRFKRREMLRVALNDVAGTAAADAIGGALADLADACLEAALVNTTIPFAVVGMGKLGGRELNYASDIDVMFVHRGDTSLAETVAVDLLSAIGEVTPEGQAFRIDAGLRPEGKSGALVRSVDAYVEYYERWAKPWELLAAIKARPSAGDHDLGAQLVDAMSTFAYRKDVTSSALSEIRHLKARMERERIPRGVDPRRHIKLGPGGMSDVEFAVQILQLTHGHAIPDVRSTNTLEAIDAMQKAALIGEGDARRLHEAYVFLGRLRNRLFLMVGRPVDVLPTKPEDLEALAVALGYSDQPRQELEDDYLRATRRCRMVAERLIFG